MKDFRFSNEHNSTQAAGVIDVLRQPRLWIPTGKDYPDHQAWLGKVEQQILDGTKRAMVAYMGREAVGTVIYQRKQGEPSMLEIKNISVSPYNHGRFIGSFLLRNSEIEGTANDFPGTNEVIVDTKVTNTDMIGFLTSHGYKTREVTDLYGLGTGLDAVLTKPIDQ